MYNCIGIHTVFKVGQVHDLLQLVKLSIWKKVIYGISNIPNIFFNFRKLK